MNKYKLDLSHINYNTYSFANIFNKYLKNKTNFKIIHVNEKNINKAFAYGIRYQKLKILNWCVESGYHLYLTDIIVIMILKYNKRKVVHWLYKANDNIILSCDLPNCIRNKYEKELYLEELICFFWAYLGRSRSFY